MNAITDNISSFDTIMAFAIPYVTAILSKRSWSSEIKGAISVALAVAFAICRTYLEGKLDLQHVSVSIMYIVILSEVFYQKFGKESTKYLQNNVGVVDKPEDVKEVVVTQTVSKETPTVATPMTAETEKTDTSK